MKPLRAVQGRRVAASLLLGVTLCLGAGNARAEIINLQWQEDARFERKLTIAAGKFVEICGPLEAGQVVRWSFQGDRATNFNVHYHLGKDVRYPTKRDQVESLQGELTVESRQDYCWMWVNKTATPAKLSVALVRN